MTELERARDRLLVAIGYALGHECHDGGMSLALDEASEGLDQASAKQHDEDRSNCATSA